MSLIRDLRLALRLLRRERLTALAVILTLGLAIGASSSVFSVVYEVLLRPLPYPAPEQLVRVYQAGPERDRGWGVTHPALTAWRQQARALTQLEGMTFQDLALVAADGPATHVRAARVTAGLLPLLGVRPALGQRWGAEAEVPGRDQVVLLSHGLWQERFGAEAAALGRTLNLGGVPHTVVGVLPADFAFEPSVQVWKPLAPEPTSEAVDPRHHFMRGVARLRPGASAQQAQRELERIAAGFVQQGGPPGAKVEPLQALLVKDVRTQLWLLAGVGALILLVACANVANLLLARATAREREVAVRAALGASRWQLLRQFLAEGLVLALASGALGLLLAQWGRDLLEALVPPALLSARSEALGVHLLLITTGLSLLTCLLAALLPALRAAQADGRGTLGDLRGARSTSGGGRARSVLVVAQVSLALVPLVGAGLMLRTLQALNAVSPGFEARGVTLAEVMLEANGAPLALTFGELLTRVRELPGVQSAGMASTVPLWERNGFVGMLRPGETLDAARSREPVNFRSVSDGYLETLGVPLRSGRALGASDGASAPAVMVVNETFVRRYFPGAEALGQRMRLGFEEEPYREIVGVVGDMRHDSLSEEPAAEVYVPMAQLPIPRMVLTVRSAVPGAALVPALREQLHAVKPGLPFTKVRAMPELVHTSLQRTRVLGALFGLLAALGLALAAVGLYGVLAYSVTQRTRELGIRAALGASEPQLMALVLRQGLWLAGVGVCLGLVAAGLLARALDSVVVGVDVLDPVTFLAVPLLLGAVALLASWLPARRALRVPPHEALRAEG